MGESPFTNRLCSPPSIVRPTRIRYLVLAAACSVAVLIYVHRVGFAQVLPYLKDDLGLSPEQTSWLTAAFLLAYGGFEIPGGLLGDRLGVRHLLPLLVLGWSLFTGCVALAVFVPDVWMWPFLTLLGMRFLFGLFQAGAFPALSRMLTDWVPLRERASAQGCIWMSTRLGGMLIPLIIAGLIVLCGNTWHAPLWILAALGVLWCAAFWPWFRNRPEEMDAVNRAERDLIAAGRGARPAGHGAVPWGRLLRSRSVWALCLMYGCGGFAANFYVTLLPTYLRDYRGLSEVETAWLSGLPFAFGLVACLGGGLLSDALIRRTGNRKWGRRLNGSVGMLLGSAAWLSTLWIHETWLLAVALCVIFFCNDLSMGPAWACCADIGERYAGTLGGAMNMIGNLAGAAGNLVAGYLFGKAFVLVLPFLEGVELAGNDLLLAIYACAFALAALCWLGVDATQALVPEERG
jgi:MFS family permease